MRWTVVALALMGLAVGQLAPVSADELDNALRRKQELERAVQVSRQNAERYQQAANQFASQVSSANARINDLVSQQNAAKTEVEKLGIQIKIAEEQLQLVTFQLTETKSLVDSLQAESDSQARTLTQREEQYGRHLRLTYRQALVSPLEMLLSSGSLSDFAARLQAMVVVNRQDVQMANEIRGLREDTAAKQETAAAKQKEILGLDEQIKTQRVALNQQKGQHEAMVAQLGSNIALQAEIRNEQAAARDDANRSKTAAQLETNELNRLLQQAEALYEQLAAEAAIRFGGGGTFSGRLALWPVNGPITSGFGNRWGGFHNGMDIAAPMYTPVRAGSSGTVATAGRPYVASGDTAVVVIIAHSSAFSTLYGHLDDSRALPVRVGQFVAAGTIIGYVGMTGWTTGPHLHLMTIANGRAVNPAGYLP